jgi:Protein of unknown function (DUF3574)
MGHFLDTAGQSTPAPVLTVKTELYLGLPETSSKTEFELFLSTVVVPRFDGFSYEPLYGVWKGVKERSIRLTIAHAGGLVDDVMLGDIIAEYKRVFKQESVLRVDSKVSASL